MRVVSAERTPVKIIEYGRYTKEEYLNELNQSLFAIFLHKSETQGLATFEAWSCNVPTLHADPGKMTFLGKSYSGVSTCPYLNDSLGDRFKSSQDFPSAFAHMYRSFSRYRPRDFVLNHFTLGHSAERFLEVIRETENASPKESSPRLSPLVTISENSL
jgi:hypothetical protein